MRGLYAFALAISVSASVSPAFAGKLILDGGAVQGGMIAGRSVPPAKITLNGRKVRVNRGGLFVIGFGRDAKPAAVLKAMFPDGSAQARTLKVKQRRYKIQRIKGLPRRMVTPDAKQIKRIRAEGRRISAARRRYTEATWYREGFVWPAHGRVSGVYGSQRILNGKPRRPHFGLDVAGPVGTPVRAAAGGIVSLADRDLYFTGGTLIIDHGHGISSVYSHLSRIDVKVGQKLSRGMLVGAIGSTGRSTGPHLDWRVNWFQTRLDPALLLGPMSNQKKK